MNGILECIKSAQFLIGLGVGFGFWLIVLVVRLICRATRGKYLKQLFKEDERGNFTITLEAIKSYLVFALKDFPSLSLDPGSVRLAEKEEGTALQFGVKFQLGGNVQESKNALYNRIESDLRNQLAIADLIKKIDIKIVDFTDKTSGEQEQ